MDADLTDRIEKLEQMNRLLLWSLIATSSAFLLTWGVMSVAGKSTTSSQPPVAPGVVDKLVARELSIVDAKGKQVAFLGIARDRPDYPDCVELKLGGPTTYTRTLVGEELAQMAVVSGKSEAFLSAIATGETGNDDGTAGVTAKNGNGYLALAARVYTRMVISDGHDRIRNIGLDVLPDAEGKADQDARLRAGRRRLTEIMRLYSQQLRGEISDAEALDRMSKLAEEDAEE